MQNFLSDSILNCSVIDNHELSIASRMIRESILSSCLNKLFLSKQKAIKCSKAVILFQVSQLLAYQNSFIPEATAMNSYKAFQPRYCPNLFYSPFIQKKALSLQSLPIIPPKQYCAAFLHSPIFPNTTLKVISPSHNLFTTGRKIQLLPTWYGTYLFTNNIQSFTQ